MTQTLLTKLVVLLLAVSATTVSFAEVTDSRSEASSIELAV